MLEGIIKDNILEDIESKIDKSQFGGRKGVGTEHLIVRFVDRILQLLESSQGRTSVVSAAVDWEAAFDRIDPTLAISKFLSLGVRATLIPLLVSYLSDRQMIVKFEGSESKPKKLVGGGPQGTLLAGVEYNVASDDCPPDSDKDNKNEKAFSDSDKYRYYDDLNILELVILSDKLIEYNFNNHVASDIAVGHLFLPPDSFKTQTYLNEISTWTDQNLMKLNELKSNYIIYSRSKTQFDTRLKLNNKNKADLHRSQF